MMFNFKKYDSDLDCIVIKVHQDKRVVKKTMKDRKTVAADLKRIYYSCLRSW